MSIESNIKKIKDEIASICNDCGRNPEDVNLMAVTKTVDVDAVLEAIEAGITDVGENKPQELARKYEVIGDKVNWHLIGTLQTNKVKYIIDKVTMIHSLDREALCEEIQKRAEKIDRVIDCLVQVNISKEESKHGILEEDAIDFVKTIAKNYPNIRIKGLMTMAPNTEDETIVRDCFKSLKQLQVSISQLNLEGVECSNLSMGMSNDYTIAIEEGATHIRLGSILFQD